MQQKGIAHDKWTYEENLNSYARLNSFWILFHRHFPKKLSLHTRLRGPLEDRDAPLPFICSLRDSDRELIHAVCCQGVNQHPPLVALLVLPACRFSLFPVSNCVRSVRRKGKYVIPVASPAFRPATDTQALQIPTLIPAGRPSPFQELGEPRRRVRTGETWPWHWCPGLHNPLTLYGTHIHRCTLYRYRTV